MKKINSDFYNKAVAASKSLENSYRNFSNESLVNSFFYEEVTTKRSVMSVVSIIVAGLIIYLRTYVIDGISKIEEIGMFDLPDKYVNLIFYVIVFTFLGRGIFKLTKIVLANKDKAPTNQLNDYANKLAEVTDKILPDFENQITMALEKEEDLIFEPVEYWEEKLNQEKDTYLKIQESYKKTIRYLTLVICLVIFLILSTTLFPFIVDGLGDKYGSASGYVVFLSYMVLIFAASAIIMNTCPIYDTKPKTIALWTFIGYQILVCMKLNTQYEILNTFKLIIESSDTDLIIDEVLFNPVTISLFLTTLIAVKLFMRVDYQSIAHYRKYGIIIPMEGSAKNIELQPEKVQGMFYIRGLFAFIATIYASIIMSDMINNDSSFVGFIWIMLVWFIVYCVLREQKVDTVYNNFAKHLYSLHFIGYVLIVVYASNYYGFSLIVPLGIHALSTVIVPFVLYVIGLL